MVFSESSPSTASNLEPLYGAPLQEPVETSPAKDPHRDQVERPEAWGSLRASCPCASKNFTLWENNMFTTIFQVSFENKDTQLRPQA